MQRENENNKKKSNLKSTPHSSHDHDALHHAHHRAVKNIQFAFALNLAFTIFEIAGGLLTNSMAVLSDALHDLGDSLTLGLSIVMEKISHRKRDRIFSYGYRRFSLLAAFVSGLVLVAGSALILFFAAERFTQPAQVHADGMIVMAIVGIVFNGIAALRLRSGRSMNESFLAWHLLEDVLGWTAILVGGILMHFLRISWIDPALSILFTLFTLFNVIKIFKRTTMIFLQSVPLSVDVHTLEKSLMSLKGIQSVHDTHLWTMDGEYNIFTTHVVVGASLPEKSIKNIKSQVRSIIHEHSIQHATIEIERPDEACDLKNC